MNRFLDFIARHAVISTTAFAILLILIGLGLLFKPSLILLILRYSFAVANFGVGLVLLIRTLLRAAQK